MILAVFDILLAFVTFVGKGEWGGRLEKNPNRHQKCILFVVFAILVAFATFVEKGGGWWEGSGFTTIEIVL